MIFLIDIDFKVEIKDIVTANIKILLNSKPFVILEYLNTVSKLN